jgi:DNA-binding protein HU-beta
MELLVIAALVTIGVIWYFNAKSIKTTAEPEAAPYKVETPTLSEMAEKAEVVATEPAAVKAKAPVKRAAPVKAKAPAKTAAKKPVAKKTVSSKKPV